MTTTLILISLILVGLLLKCISEMKRMKKAELYFLNQIDDLTEEFILNGVIMKNQDNAISELRGEKRIYKTALQKISEKQYIQFGVPTAPYATFIPPYQIASEALEEAE